MSSLKFAAFDFETTGMDPIRDKIIELGVVVFQKDRVLRAYHQLVNPGIPVPKEAFDIHGIDDKLLEGEPKLAEILPECLSLFSDAVPMAHNASFDFSFLMEALLQNGLPLARGPVVDTCLLAKDFFPEFSTHRLQFLAGTLGIARDKAHRALSDAQSCHALFCKIVERLPKKWETSWEEFKSFRGGILSFNVDEMDLPEMFHPLKKAFLQRDRILLSYKDGKGKITEREVTPMGITFDRKRTVLVGYCHLRQGTRSFRLDRILGFAGNVAKG